MGLTYNIYLNGKRIYGCGTCKTHLSNHEDILSRVRLSHSISLSSTDARRTSAASMARHTSLTKSSTSPNRTPVSAT